MIDREETLSGEPGAVVRGGIVVRADGVTVRDLTVVGGEHVLVGMGLLHARDERVPLEERDLPVRLPLVWEFNAEPLLCDAVARPSR